MPIANNKNYNLTFSDIPNYVFQVGERITCETTFEATTTYIKAYKITVFGSITDFAKSNYNSIELLTKHNKDPPKYISNFDL